ncbi:MAG: hypothetical protein IJ925_09000 [Muribaculaceae bacterium]|nr:hypothetical protein [Muribaculaceae bacterium]
MRKLLVIMLLAFMCVSCENRSSVNLLVSNMHERDALEVLVTVDKKEILQHLDATSLDALVLLDERNEQIHFTSTPDGECLQFVVPSVKAYSQKNYTLNIKGNNFADNLFSFRKTNIYINL